MISLEQWRILIGSWYSGKISTIHRRGSLKRKDANIEHTTINFLELLLQAYGSSQRLKLWVCPSAATILRLLVALSVLLAMSGTLGLWVVSR